MQEERIKDLINTIFYEWVHMTKLASLQNLPAQVTPSPSNPVLQVQVYEPSVFSQSALSLQLCAPVTHSSISSNIWLELTQS